MDGSTSTSSTSIAGAEPRPIDRLLKPVRMFARHKLAGAGLLMLATAVALVWANSPWAHHYQHVLHLEIALSVGGFTLANSVHHWINDGLMGVFFFYVGLEIKREILVGELSTLRQATLPAVAAVGGMLAPAGIYFAVNGGSAAAKGWGIPMATDIAFALGVLALLGDRVPPGLKVFLTALAIVDDIGAVVVIAVFYTADVSWVGLAVGFGFLGVSILLNRLGSQNPVVYLLVGIGTWLGFLESGVHATIAAILMAFTIPARTRIDGGDFARRMKMYFARLEQLGLPTDKALNTNKQQALFERMNDTIDQASAPLTRTEHALHGPVTFFVLPIFALANAGVAVGGNLTGELTSPIVIGIVAGLVAGKLVGITAASWLAVKLRLADLPKGVGWLQIAACALLAGIGFTMALFVAGLAFADPARVETAKVGILAASLVAGAIGFGWLRLVTGTPQARSVTS